MLLYMAALVPKHTKPLKGGTSFDCVGQRVASASLLCVLEMHTASIALVFGTSLGVGIPRFSLGRPQPTSYIHTTWAPQRYVRFSKSIQSPLVAWARLRCLHAIILWLHGGVFLPWHSARITDGGSACCMVNLRARPAPYPAAIGV